MGGVVINGVIWATRNVDKPGTFAKNLEDAGMLYQWNRDIGWSTTDPLINTNRKTTWNNSLSTDTFWKMLNNPCPVGWRVPTKEEFETLLDRNKVGYERITENGLNGKFTDKTNGSFLFLPAAGSRKSIDGTLYYAGTSGNYWSNTVYEGDETNAYCVGFGTGFADVYNCTRSLGLSIRCVAK